MKRRYAKGEFKRTTSTDPDILDKAVASEGFWVQAAAFGVSEAGKEHATECTYLDAIIHLANKRPKQDKRFGNRGHKTQQKIGDTMRRKLGSEL